MISIIRTLSCFLLVVFIFGPVSAQDREEMGNSAQAAESEQGFALRMQENLSDKWDKHMSDLVLPDKMARKLEKLRKRLFVQDDDRPRKSKKKRVYQAGFGLFLGGLLAMLFTFVALVMVLVYGYQQPYNGGRSNIGPIILGVLAYLGTLSFWTGLVIMLISAFIPRDPKTPGQTKSR